MEKSKVLTQTVRVGAHDLIIETGKLARQAHGAVTVSYGDTVVFVATVAADSVREGVDFFPLTVDYREKAAAAGKMPGGYFKREGRPTEKEILTSRVIDRPIRALFPDSFRNEVQVQSILLSADMENDPDILAINGASAALMISDIPFDGPIGAVRVGRIAGKFVANPTHGQMRESDIDLVYVGTETELMMIEGSANEVSEGDMMSAIEFAHEIVRQLVAAQKEMAAKLGVTKRKFALAESPKEWFTSARKHVGAKLKAALDTTGKAARNEAVGAVKKEMKEKLVAEVPEIKDGAIKEIFYQLQTEIVRAQILTEGKRMDGRGMREIRPIFSEVGLLPRTHGSAVFQRGETQALVITTLGSTKDAQELDVYGGGPVDKKFILHYNFPPFSTGEVKRIMGPGRREIGHGALAERSVLPVIPLQDFPYTVRVTAEILESNGSSSMATVCGATLSLMDAGVPITSPVAGISIGLVKEGDRAALLTDILGAEDGMGDMDFKVAGTRKGITGFQVDLKIRGLSFDLARGAFEEARIARYSILDEMAKVLPAPRKEMSRHAPRILTVRVATEKIGAIIGPGGKTINKITAETGVEIDIQDTGEVFIFSSNAEASERAAEMIRGLTAEAEVGKSYHGKVVSIKEFGAFVEYMPGKDGMVHVSEMADFRVNRVEDVCKVGDDMWVKIIEVDDRGRVRLSRKAALEERDAVARGEPVPEYKPQPRESRDSRGPRPDSRGPRPDSRQDSRGPRSDSRGPRSDSRQDSRPDSRQDSRPDSRQDTRPDTRPDSRGPRPDYRGGRPDAREARPEPREARPEQRPPPAHGTPAAFVGGDDIPVRDGGED